MVIRVAILSLCLVLCWSRVAVSRLTFEDEENILKRILQKYAAPTSKTYNWLDNSESEETMPPAYMDEETVPPAYMDEEHDKRVDTSLPEFNNCKNEDMPFPCKSEQCISLLKICDGHSDCTDGYDEDPAVCRAYHRIPVEDLAKFVGSQARWMIPAFFDGVVKQKSDLTKIAHALAVSSTIDDFARRLKLNRDQKKEFEKALLAVRSNDITPLEEMGMSPGSWLHVKTVFKNLIDSKFLS